MFLVLGPLLLSVLYSSKSHWYFSYQWFTDKRTGAQIGGEMLHCECSVGDQSSWAPQCVFLSTTLYITPLQKNLEVSNNKKFFKTCIMD